MADLRQPALELPELPYWPGLIVGMKHCPSASSAGKHAVIYRGVEYTVMPTAEPDVWEWRFQLGDSIKTGRTQTRLAALAARRVQSKIDAALRAAKSSPPGQER
jgi:hypothetical protein